MAASCKILRRSRMSACILVIFCCAFTASAGTQTSASKPAFAPIAIAANQAAATPGTEREYSPEEEHESNGPAGSIGVPMQMLPFAGLAGALFMLFTTWRLAPSTSRKRFALLIALVYGVIMLSLCTGVRLYSLSPYHRLQAEALLQGHLYLGDTIEQMSPGLAWHDGHVQQVWGLGIGFWLLPFQAIWRLCGGRLFPDRIALGIAFALLAYYTCVTGIRFAANGRRTFGLGFVWLVLLCPPLWTLARASQLVFEETVLYGLLISLGILISLVRAVCFDTNRDYWLGCVLAALIGFVRPTHIIYGFCAVLITSVLLLIRRRAVKTVLAATLCFVAGLTILGITNTTRFGSPWEFGHRLTVNTDSMVYLTRFGNPYSDAGNIDATKELLGALFLNRSVRDAGAFSQNLFPGQTDNIRWRRLYLTLFDPVYAFLCLSAVVGGTLWLVRRRNMASKPDHAMMLALWFWAGFSLLVLWLFYLRFPIIASRYLLDFLPGIEGLLILAWWFLSMRSPKRSVPLPAIWLLFELFTARVPVQESTNQTGPVMTLPRVVGQPLEDFGGNYTLSHHPTETGIAGNGRGWEPETGFADDLVTLALDRPQFLELRVSDRRMINGQPPRMDVYRAMLKGQELILRETSREGDEVKVVFDVPENLRSRIGLVFLCFSSGYDAEDRDSERFIFSAWWR